MWAIQQRLQALLAERKIRIEMDEELAESVRVIEAWRQHYKRELPHSAPGCEPRSGSRAGSARSNSMKVPSRRSLQPRAYATISTAQLPGGPDFGGACLPRGCR
jgi:hypothetical protein